MAPELKPAYLIHGDDHGAIAERRARLRARVEHGDFGDGGSVEVLEGDRATPAALAGELAAMTLAVGRRVILVEGVERWRAADVEKHLGAGAGDIPPQTTVALFAREEARTKAPDAVHELVKRAQGQVIAQMSVKPWELPKWVVAQAAGLGLELDSAAAKALIAQTGERQQRLLRELEKLALFTGARAAGADTGEEASARTRVSSEDIDALAASSSEWRAFALADALLAGDARAAVVGYVRLREQGERLAGLSYLMAQRLRDALACALELSAGASAASVKRKLRMPARAAERFMRDVARAEPAHLRDALVALADLELDSRGGAVVPASRSATSSLHEDTLVLRAIARICP
jgi:DNA polymerase-3 subunit delta